jgi:homoserine O-acetyltransferase
MGIEFPGFVRRLLPMATTARESAQGIAFNEVGRQAIMQDPEWNHGDYRRAAARASASPSPA